MDRNVAVRLSGKITSEDYAATFIPAMEKALLEHERLRILVITAEDFDGYSLEAILDDARFGLAHWRGFERIAIVSDVGWLRASMKIFSVLAPCPMRMFRNGEEDEAGLWLREAFGTVHINPRDDGLLITKFIGKLEPDAYDNINEDMALFINKHGRIKVLIDLRDFDGWESLSAFESHFELVKSYHHAPKQVAVVGNARWQNLAERVFSKFVDADVQYFPALDIEKAERWIGV